MRLFALFAAAAVLAPVAVIAPVSAASTPQAAEAKQKERRICRRSMITGTRVGTQRICMTQREWDENEDEQRGELRRFQDRQVCTKGGLSGSTFC